MNRKYWIETYGCQMNVAETGSMELALAKGGWTPAKSDSEADLVLLNTCSVRKTAENRIWGRLGYYKRMKESRNFILGIMGCMTERLKTEIRKKVPVADILIGTFGKEDFIQALLENRLKPGDDFLTSKEYHFALKHSGKGDFQAMIPIMHGCDNFCSYCIVPHVRGREISRSPGDILSELQALEAAGVREITLLGQNVNSYRYENTNGLEPILFPDLLSLILKETRIPWIRFMSSHPKDLSPELIRIIGKNPRICRHIHLPVQHGSNKILSAMNRKYTIEEYLRLVAEIRNAAPNVSLTTDILLGFPGEDEQDFKETLSLIDEVGFDDAFTYLYNAIEGTNAFSLPNQVPEDIKKSRLSELIERQRLISGSIRKRFLGTEETVLVEGISRRSAQKVLARTEHNQMVVFEGSAELTGQFCQVQLKSIKGSTFQGELVCPGD